MRLTPFKCKTLFLAILLFVPLLVYAFLREPPVPEGYILSREHTSGGYTVRFPARNENVRAVPQIRVFRKRAQFARQFPQLPGLSADNRLAARWKISDFHLGIFLEQLKH